MSACTRKEAAKTQDPESSVVLQNPHIKLEQKKVAEKDRILSSFARLLMQADAIHREAWWVVAADRKVQGKSIFGKLQRAIISELGEKIANKNVFSCDRYFVKREILSMQGFPQKGEAFEKCVSGGSASFAEYEIKNENLALIIFYPQHLNDVVGLATSILNRKIRCTLNGSGDDKLEKLHCENLAQDRNASQSIQFSVYNYERAGQNLIEIKGQVYEDLLPIRKIEAKVPLEGKISVVETQVEAPEGYILKSRVPVEAPTPKVKAAIEGAPSSLLAPPPPRDAVLNNQPPAEDTQTAPAAAQHGDLPEMQQQQQPEIAPAERDPNAPQQEGFSYPVPGVIATPVPVHNRGR